MSNDLKERFEFIIVDAPPVFPLADMNLLASLADMLLIVIRAGVTPGDVVQRAVRSLKPSGRAGIIMTACDEGRGLHYAVDQYASSKVAY